MYSVEIFDRKFHPANIDNKKTEQKIYTELIIRRHALI